MPLPKGKSKKATKKRFHEFRHGKTYAKTVRKYSKARANKQLQAVALQGKGKKRRKTRSKRKSKR